MKKYRKIRKKLILICFIITMFVTYVSNMTIYAAKPDRIVPSTPGNLTASTITDTTVTLTWSRSTDNIGVKSYQIYKNNSLIGTSTTNTYTVNNLTFSTTYEFYVVAKDAAGNVSKTSNIVSVTTLAAVAQETTTVASTESATQTATQSSTTATQSPTTATTSTTTATQSTTQSTTQTSTTGTTSGKKVVGYYAAWSAYSGFTPDKLDVTKLTHINYAFANISSDLKIAMGYPDIDPGNFTKLKALKQINPSLKTLISVGGWSWSGRFSDVALTDASRTAFADSCVDFIVQYGFDGVDIDWEYPVTGGLSTNVRRPEDKQNFTLLIQKLREKLNARGLVDNKSYLLTFAGAAGSWYVNNVELSSVGKYVDYANVMTYDIHGPWNTYTDFNAPLYSNTDITNQDKWSVDQSVNAWLNAGFPASKLIMGVPFYGYIYKSVANVNNGLYQTYSGAQSISYANIAANYLSAPGFIRYYHSTSMVPWLYNGSTFITYDDPQSITVKAQYVKNRALGGAAIWELSQDPNKVLLTPLYNGLK